MSLNQSATAAPGHNYHLILLFLILSLLLLVIQFTPFPIIPLRDGPPSYLPPQIVYPVLPPSAFVTWPFVVDDDCDNCRFPFMIHGIRKYECIRTCRNARCRNVCPTKCNNQTKWINCSYLQSDLLLPNCSNLANATQSSFPSQLFHGRGTGTQCVFPFLYDGRCHYDCYKTSVVPWCSTTMDQSKAEIDVNYKYCPYTLAGINSKSCASLNSTEQSLQPYSLQSGKGNIPTDPYGNCTFPFYFDGKCYDDCTSDGDHPWYAIWCSTTKFYQPNLRMKFCSNYISYRNVTSLSLRWGFYRIYSTNNSIAVTAASVDVPAAARGSQRVALSASNSSSQMWELLPQPNGFFILREVVDCGIIPKAWSINITDVTVENITSEREFWNIQPVDGGQSFQIESTHNDTAGMKVSVQSVSGHSVLVLLNDSTDSWRFEEISNLEKSQLKVCDAVTVFGEWCSWSSYEVVGKQLLRSRNCSCPSAANGGADCAGSSQESIAVTDGSWCSWSSFQLDGPNTTRSRNCSCPSPGLGGDACIGDGVDSHVTANGSWCSWSEWQQVGVSHVTRSRSCSCPNASVLGAACEGNSSEMRATTTSNVQDSATTVSSSSVSVGRSISISSSSMWQLAVAAVGVALLLAIAAVAGFAVCRRFSAAAADEEEASANLILDDALEMDLEVKDLGL